MQAVCWSQGAEIAGVLRRINFQLKKTLMKGKQRPSRPKKIARKAGSEEARKPDGRPATAGSTGGGKIVPTTADFSPIASGKAPTMVVKAPLNDEEDQRNIHNGSAGAFEAAEGGREEEDSDEDNDDLAMGH
jgi:hypothetical protein